MPRRQQDREDILREATALVERAELTVPGFAESIVIGFRAGGAASVFCGADPVYQFNLANELRRAYRDGRLIKAVGGKLFELERRRAQGQLQLIRRELDGDATRQLLETCRQTLHHLQQSLDSGNFTVVGRVPDEANVVERIRHWLAGLRDELSAADKPNVA